MAEGNNKNLILFSLVAVWAVVAFFTFNNQKIETVEVIPHKQGKFSSKGLDVDLELLEQGTGKVYNETIDIFSFRGVPEVIPKAYTPPVILPVKVVEPVKVKSAPKVQKTVVPVGVPQKKNETIAALKYLGFVKKPSGVVLFLSIGGKIAYAEVGDIIDGDVFIKDANDNAVLVQDINTHEELKIEISG